MNNRIWVYDIETSVNCFTYTAMERDTKQVVQFTIWRHINELEELVVHLENCKGLIGFNNINFDYPVIHYILTCWEEWVNLDSDEITDRIYKKAQEVISEEWSSIDDLYVKIPQLDLFRIWHFNNVARMTSLKKLQIAFRYQNVQDMPYAHYETIETEEQVHEILDYNLNDVDATREFYLISVPKIELRKELYKRYGLKCMNYPDSKIGEDLTLQLYCNETGESYNEVRKRRTHRKQFKFSECLPKYVNFETSEFNDLLSYLKGIEVTELKGSFKYDFEYNGFQFDLGTGGIHGCIRSGVYDTTDTHVIVDVDVASLYPSLAIAMKLYPEHLGEEFVKVYEEGIVKPRLKAKKDGDKVMNLGFKLSANSCFGKSNSEYSWLYDPLYTLKTTLGGQISLCMLSERLMTKVNDLTMLQINTDGLTAIIPKTEKRNFYNQCQEWEKETGLVLEYVAYEKMVIRDVNNYMAKDFNGKVKYKGALKPYEEVMKDEEYHKSVSQTVVPKAVSEFFLNGVPVEETVMKCDNIYDFCKTFNTTHGWKCATADIDIVKISPKQMKRLLTEKGWRESLMSNWFVPPSGGNMAGVMIPNDDTDKKIYRNVETQQKTNRYFVSTIGKTFLKVKDDRRIEIEAGGTLVTIFNKFVERPILDYNIDYDYYIKECYKIVHKIDGTEERMLEEQRQEREKEQKKREEANFLKYCWNKPPTERQLGLYGKPWLLEKYGTPKIKK